VCGIAGVAGWTDEAVLGEMLARLEHRGPDGEGRFVDEDAGVMLGARRLAIIDLARGDQPVTNEDGTVVVAFNGELYNHAALRDRLREAGHRFRSACDTEVLVHLWEEEGPALVERLDGMFAFSIWDAEAGTLFLARDRLGIKPLYYSDTPDGLVWGSEVPALLAAGVDTALDPAAVYNYFRLGYVPWPRTLFASVASLPPGGLALLTPDGLTVRRYWRLGASGSPSATSVGQAARQLRGLLETAVERRLMADVPVGTFLSGGLDSSAVTALVARRTDDLSTFSVAFPGEPFDESGQARAVADALGTDHHEVAVDLDALTGFGDLVGRLSAPPSHVQFLPIYALSQLARREGVTVALAGEGADELFGGYPRYRQVHRTRWLVGTMPDLAYAAAGRLSRVTPVGHLPLAYLAELRSGEAAVHQHACGFDRFRPPPEAYLDTALDDETAGLAGTIRTAMATSAGSSPGQYLMAYDVAHLLPDFVLYKSDHTSMAASLEVRVPFLDHRIVEFAHRLPAGVRIVPADEKAVVKRAVRDLVPRSVIEREKYGMGLPVDDWFRSDHDGIARWLSESRLAETPFVDADRVLERWADHRHGRGRYGRMLWTMLAFVAWYHEVVARGGHGGARVAVET